MKYCKRCFRNIDDKYTVCPFCNQSDKLIDYSSESRSSGEKFECSEVEKKHNKEEDVYSVSEPEDTDPYDDIYEEEEKQAKAEFEKDIDLSNMTSAQRQEVLHKLINEKQKAAGLKVTPSSTVGKSEKTRTVIYRDLSSEQGSNTPKKMPMIFKIIYCFIVLFNPMFAIIGYVIFARAYKYDESFKILATFMIMVSVIFALTITVINGIYS